MSKHAAASIAGGEYTLCGLAFDAYESGDHHELVVEARPGELVTCKECRAAIDHARSQFKGYRFSPTGSAA
jgi:hypothetical protein